MTDPNSAIARRGVACVLALAFTLSLVRYGYDGVFRALVGPQHDFAVYYAAGKAIRLGENPYDLAVICRVMHDPGMVCYGLYPPFLAIATVPLTYLSFGAASIVWFCLNHLWLIASVAVMPLAFPLLPRWVVWMGAGWLMLNLWPVGFSLDVGNVNVLLVLLLTLAFCAHVRKRVWATGGLVALAAMIKLHPILFIPYALWTRQYKLLVAICLGCCIIGCACLAVVGLDVHRSWIDGLRTYITQGSNLSVDDSVVHPANQSIAAFWARLMVPNQHTSAWWHAPRLAQWLNLAVCLALWLLTMALCARGAAPAHVRGLEFGALVALAVVASTQSWEHHYALLFVPFCVGLCHLVTDRRRPMWLALLAMAYVLVGMEYEYHHKAFETGVLIPVMSIKLLAGLLLLGLLLGMMASEKRRAQVVAPADSGS